MCLLHTLLEIVLLKGQNPSMFIDHSKLGCPNRTPKEFFVTISVFGEYAEFFFNIADDFRWSPSPLQAVKNVLSRP